MLRRQNNRLLGNRKSCTRDSWDLNELLHHARAYGHPSRVVNDADLTLNEKRAILASWASDACTPAADPDPRCIAGVKRPVQYDDVMDALRALDKQAHELGSDGRRYRWRWWKSRAQRHPPRSYRERHALN